MLPSLISTASSSDIQQSPLSVDTEKYELYDGINNGSQVSLQIVIELEVLWHRLV